MAVEVSQATLTRAQRVMERCAALARHSEERERLTRRFATPALAAARAELAEWFAAAGLEVRRDAVGNLIGRRPARSGGVRTLLLGSHIDTVRDAGRYDGPLGVLVALEVIEALGAERADLALEVLAIADEEGVRFRTTYLGSRALVGDLDEETLRRVDDGGISMREAILADGGDPAAIPAEARDPASLRGYLEVHIEQGPQLEALGLPVGVVNGIAGGTRYLVRFVGNAGHAGTVAPELRRDALCGAAEFVLAVERLAGSSKGLMATVGQMRVEPGAANVIPGQVVLSLDVRHVDDGIRRQHCEALLRQAAMIAARRGLNATWDQLGNSPATRCDEGLQGCLAAAVAAQGLAVERMVSGAGHDAVVLSAITPVGMLFVRCREGVSHHPAESVMVEDVAVAIAVMDGVVHALIDEAGHGDL